MITAAARARAMSAMFPAAVVVSLHRENPGTGGAHELSGGGYERLAMPYAVDQAGVLRNTGPLYFMRLPAGTVGAIGVWDAYTGEFVRGDLVPVQDVPAGGVVIIDARDLAFTIEER